MSKAAAQRAIRQLAGRPALIAPESVNTASVELISNHILADLRELAGMTETRAQLADMWQIRKAQIAADYWGDTAQMQDKPFAYSDGTAVIPVHGSLINRYSWSWSWATGYNFIRSQLDLANADMDVKRIILDVNSYGGTVAGCIETADAIAKSGKPVLAMVDDSCFSAAYWLASQANRINVVPSGRAGSVGVVLMHMDVSKALGDMGINITLLYAGAHKVDGNPYEPLSDAVKAEFQTDINACYDQFVAAVSSGRKMSEQSVRGTEARCYRADEALDLGLIDGVSDMNTAVAQFTSGEEDDPPMDCDETEAAKETHMNEIEAAKAEGIKEGAAAAQTRISAILTSPEAEGRSALANHLAFNSDMSAENAVAALKASAKEAPPAPAPTPAPAPKEDAENPAFQAAMRNATHPNVPAGGGTQEQSPQGELAGAARLLAAQKMVFGSPKAAATQP